MHVAVIGVGAVGGALAAALDRAGVQVTAVVRPTSSSAAAIRSHGLRLDGARGTHTAHPTVAEQLPTNCDLVVVAVRSFQLESALTPHAERLTPGGDLAHVPVVVAQNGLLGPDTAARLIGRNHGVLGALALYAATGHGDGRVTLTGGGAVRVGALHPGDFALAAEVAAVIAPAFAASPVRDLRGALWSKLLVNHVNALPAVTGRSVQWCCRQPSTARIVAASLTETVTVADRAGVRFAPLGLIGPATVAQIRSGDAATLVRSRLASAFGVRPNPASTLQSIRRGEPTEIDALNGAVVMTAASLRCSAPVNRMLVGLVHEVERRGRFYSLARLREVARYQGVL